MLTWTLGLFLVMALTGCGPGELTPTPTPPAYDLVARHAEAIVRSEVEFLSLADPATRDVLLRGWAFPVDEDEDEDEAEAGTASGSTRAVSTDDARAELLLHLSEPADRVLVLRGSDPQEGGSVRVALNDADVGTVEWSAALSESRLELPADLQRRGANILALLLEPVPDKRGASGRPADRRSLHVESVRVEVPDTQLAQRLQRARRAVPTGALTQPDAGLLQAVGTRVIHHLRLPAGAVLHGVVEGPDVPRDGPVFRVHLTTDAGPSRVLWEGPAGSTFDVPLGEPAGTAVRLELELDAQGATPAGRWRELAVSAGALANADLDAGTDTGIGTGTGTSTDAGRESSAPGVTDASLRGAPVIVLLIDTLRPSVLGSHGGSPELAPHLDRLAREGVRFEQAMAPASFTIASVASLLTGTHTWTHDTWQWGATVPESVTTYAQAFRQAGYRTAGVTFSPNGSSRFGFGRGFDDWVDDWKGHTRADAVLDHADRVLAEDDGRPLFLWLHVLEPHEPYHPPAPWRDTHDPSYEGEITGSPAVLWDIRKRVLVPTPRDIEHLRAEYADNVAWVDSVVGRLRSRLEDAGLWDEALVAVVSDHGEGFLEHDGKVHAGMGHSSTVYDEMVQVPLLLRLPSRAGLAGVVVPEPVASFDLLPTLLELVGAPVPPRDALAGPRSQASRIWRATGAVTGAGDDDRVLLTHSQSHEAGRLAPSFGLRQGRWKLVATTGDAPELYDIPVDPGERRDLAADRPVLTGLLLQTLRRSGAVEGGTASALPAGLDPETLKELQALGYLMGER